MTIRIADLNPESEFYEEELQSIGASWIRILPTLRSLKVLDAATLDRMASPTQRVEVTEEQAREIGRRLERWIFRDLERQFAPRPTIPSYIVPIATSNGLWIDPALPVLNRRSPPTPVHLYTFLMFCLGCKGFAVN